MRKLSPRTWPFWFLVPTRIRDPYKAQMMNTFRLPLSDGGTSLSVLTWYVDPFSPLQVQASSATGWSTSFINRAYVVWGGRPGLSNHHQQCAKILSTRMVVLTRLSWFQTCFPTFIVIELQSDWETTGHAGKAWVSHPCGINHPCGLNLHRISVFLYIKWG